MKFRQRRYTRKFTERERLREMVLDVVAQASPSSDRQPALEQGIRATHALCAQQQTQHLVRGFIGPQQAIRILPVFIGERLTQVRDAGVFEIGAIGQCQFAWLAIAFLGTLCFSAGNLLSSRMQSMGLHPFATNSWAMLIGAGVLTVGSALAGFSFSIESDARYLGALAYLAIFGSVIGFTAYLMLVGRIGPERAAYCTVLFPIVALAASTVFEGYRWSALAVLGLLLVVAGNLVAFDLTRRLFVRRVRASRGPAG